MHLRNATRSPLFAVPCAAAVLLAVASPAAAQERVEREGRFERDDGFQRIRYPVEIEPHFTFGAENVYGASGVGGGLRVSIPFLASHIGRFPENLAVTFGGDIVHYDDCWSGGYCAGNYLMLPVAAQWNILFTRNFSMLFELGAYVYKGWYESCGPGCNGPSEGGILPVAAVGGRIHLHDNVALVIRAGYPTSTVGVSFL